MLPRVRWLICLACLGCQAAPFAPPQPTPPQPAPPPIRHDHLSLAAASMSDGNDEQACNHLLRHIEVQPEHRNARFLLAELLYQRGQFAAAREHFEKSIALSQANEAAETQHLLHCHGRLLSIGEASDDGYEVALQRGIGLVLLAQARKQLGDPSGELPVEGLLCRAAGSLTAAHTLRPDEARPCWYLHEVWRQLGQTALSERWLKESQAAAAFSTLTSVEHCRMSLAGQASATRRYP